MSRLRQWLRKLFIPRPPTDLSDGVVVRALEGTFRQAEMFSLKGRIPIHESIMTVKDRADALMHITFHNFYPPNARKFREALNDKDWWRTSSYGVYARGFEEKLDKPVGDSIVWVEDGVPYTFEVPDVKHPLDPDKGLRQAAGMLDFALDKLHYDEGRRVVSVVPDFNPESDVAVRDIMRPSEWALVDADGYPLRTEPSREGTSEAILSCVRHYDEFGDKATGWHGSVACHIWDWWDSFLTGFDITYWREVRADLPWQFGSGVAVVSRDAIVAGNDAPIVQSVEQSGAIAPKTNP